MPQEINANKSKSVGCLKKKKKSVTLSDSWENSRMISS